LANPIHRFYAEHAEPIARMLAFVSWLAALALVAVAWSEPRFRVTSIVAALLSLVAGISWWRARLSMDGAHRP
jgi:hypothetical protein